MKRGRRGCGRIYKNGPVLFYEKKADRSGKKCLPVLPFAKEGVNKFPRFKIAQVIDLFSYSDETNGNFKLSANIGHYTAFSRAVKLCERETGKFHRFMKSLACEIPF